MNPKSKTSIFTAIVTALITFACLGGAPATGTPPEATEAPIIPTEQTLPKDGKLEITSASSYIDSFNDFNVAGEIVNNTNDALENITLSLSITDASGASLLKDDNDNPVEQIEIQPYISVLAPGASSPFSYYISVDEIQPADFKVDIQTFDTSSQPDPVTFDIQNVQTSFAGDDVFLTGEVVNLSSDQVDVETLAGAVLDSKDKVLAANSTLTYARHLYPAGDPEGRDRGPFIVKLFGPIQDVAQWKMYVRPVVSSAEPPTDMDIQLSGSYIDTYGTYHLLGKITNNGSSQISPSVIGSLYFEDQTVMDTATLNIPMYLNAGETTAFDINTFQVIGYQPSETALQTASSVKPDLFWTFTTENETVALEKNTLKISNDDYTWSAAGTVTNTSDKDLSNITTMIQCVDANDQLIAVAYTSIYPAEDASSIQPGATSEFSADLYPPADTEDLSSCTASFQGITAN